MTSIVAAAEPSLVIVPQPERETIRVRGKDARTWLNGLASADIASVTLERGTYSLLLSKVGKVQTDLDVIADAEGLLLGVAAGLGVGTAALLERYLIMEDAELQLEPGLGWVHLHGADALETARRVQPSGVSAYGSIDWLGSGGAALVMPRQAMAALSRRLLELGGPLALLASTEDWKALRLRRTFPEFGTDYGPEDNPHEAALDRRAVSWSKGCYLGQEVVCMQDLRGKLKRRLVLLRVAGSEPLEASADVNGADTIVGRITSSVGEGEAVLALARLKAPFFEGSTPLSVGGRAAEIVTESRH